jgi:hypothetical protein
VGKGEKNLLFLLPLATKLGTFHWPPNIRTFLWPPNIGTFLWPPSFGTFPWPPSFGSTFTSLFLFFENTNSDHWGFSFSPDIIFNSILRTLVPTSFLKRKRMINFGSWEKEGK